MSRAMSGRAGMVAWLMVAAGVCVSGVAVAQVVPPAPPAPAPTPAYEPPAPPPAPPVPVAAKVVETPNIVERDGQGRLVVLTQTSDEAALSKMTLEAEKAGLRAQVMEERRARVHAMLSKQATTALAVRRAMPTVDGLELQGVMELAPQVRVLNVQPSLGTMMMQAGAISQAELDAVNRAGQAYNQALAKEADPDNKGGGGAMQAIARTQMRRAVFEALREYDALLLKLAGQWAGVKGTLGDAGDAAALSAAEAKVASATSDGAKIEAMMGVLATYNAEQQAKALSAVATPTPANAVVPASAAPVVRPAGR
jgi:hypothetical protein